jgi:hypothetical protein
MKLDLHTKYSLALTADGNYPDPYSFKNGFYVTPPRLIIAIYFLATKL